MAAIAEDGASPDANRAAGVRDQHELRVQWREQAASVPGTVLLECTAPSSTVSDAESVTLLFRNPQAVLVAMTAGELPELLARVETALEDGYYVAGYFTYEAGCVLEGGAAHAADPPLAWFGIYTAPQRLPADPSNVPAEFSSRFPLCWEMATERAHYLDQVAAAQRLIAAGETYQVNLTTAVSSSFRGEVASLYTALWRNQPTAFSALLHPVSGRHILSFSPELLLRVEAGGHVVTRPMKGTAAVDASADVSSENGAAAWLQADEKSRAEHVMIVDLLRNDLNRVAVHGSVHVDPLFAVERYNTVVQMTSTVAGQLRPGMSFGEIMRSLLPPGSMTGAPKHRTIEILRELERKPRGVYSGALGYAAPDGTSVFSVPIRTLVLEHEQLHMGVGGGIVADSQAEDELAECWLKCDFLHRASLPYELVETFRWDGFAAERMDGTPAREEIEAQLLAGTRPLGHLDRLEVSAHSLGFRFDRQAVWDALVLQTAALAQPHRLRLLLARNGEVRFQTSPLDLWPDLIALRVSPEVLWSGDSFLRHKTSYRPVYDRELARARADGFADTLFANERGELAEGAISSVFLFVDGAWWTPSLSTGLLPGVARARLLRTGHVGERTLLEADLRRATAVSVANGVRGSAPVRRLQLRDGEELHFPAAPTLPLC